MALAVCVVLKYYYKRNGESFIHNNFVAHTRGSDFYCQSSVLHYSYLHYQCITTWCECRKYNFPQNWVGIPLWVTKIKWGVFRWTQEIQPNLKTFSKIFFFITVSNDKIGHSTKCHLCFHYAHLTESLAMFVFFKLVSQASATIILWVRSWLAQTIQMFVVAAHQNHMTAVFFLFPKFSSTILIQDVWPYYGNR